MKRGIFNHNDYFQPVIGDKKFISIWDLVKKGCEVNNGKCKNEEV